MTNIPTKFDILKAAEIEKIIYNAPEDFTGVVPSGWFNMKSLAFLRIEALQNIALNMSDSDAQGVSRADFDEVLQHGSKLLLTVKAAQEILAEWILPDSIMTNNDALQSILGAIDVSENIAQQREFELILARNGL